LSGGRVSDSSYVDRSGSRSGRKEDGPLPEAEKGDGAGIPGATADRAA